MIGTMKAELVRAIVIGSVLIVLGLVPGLFQRLKEGIKEGIHTFSESLRSPFSPVSVRHKADHENVSRPITLALVGVAVILLGLLSYFSSVSR